MSLQELNAREAVLMAVQQETRLRRVLLDARRNLHALQQDPSSLLKECETADQIFPKGQACLERIVGEALAQLQPENQCSAFRMAWQETQAVAEAWLARLQAQTLRREVEVLLSAEVEAAEEEILARPQDAQQVLVALERAERALRQQGQDPEEIADWLSGLVLRVLGQLVEIDLLQAEAFFQLLEGRLSDPEPAKRLLKAAARRQQVPQLVETFLVLSPEKLEAELTSLKEEGLANAVRQTLEQKQAAQAFQAQEVSRSLEDQAWALLLDQGHMEAIPLALWLQMPKSVQDVMQHYAQLRARGHLFLTSVPLWRELHQQSLWQTATFVERNLMLHVTELSTRDLADLRQRQQRLKSDAGLLPRLQLQDRELSLSDDAMAHYLAWQQLSFPS